MPELRLRVPWVLRDRPEMGGACPAQDLEIHISRFDFFAISRTPRENPDTRTNRSRFQYPIQVIL